MRKIAILLIIILLLTSFTGLISNENVKADGTSTFEDEQDISPNYFNFMMEYPTDTDVETTVQTDFSLLDRSEKKWSNERYFDITATEAKQMIDMGYIATMIDIRNPGKYNYYHIDGAINIPLQEFECESCLFNTLYESKNNLMIVYSQRGEKSKFACDFLLERGFKKVFNMVDGLDNWIENGFAIIESSDINNMSILENNTKYYTGAIFEDPSEVPEKLYPLPVGIGMLDLLPSELDWSNYNGKDWTSPVKNQGGCGSCWAFAALGTLESIINIREGQPDYDLDLSEQYILSCLPSAGSCGGGSTSLAFKYIMNTSAEGNYFNGIIPESCMPYEADDDVSCADKCPDWEEYLIPIIDYGIEYNPSIERIKQLLAYNGPVTSYFTVYQDFNPNGPSFDENGIYQYDGFSEYSGGHAIVLVGYKDTPSNPNYSGYWICKNSWGSSWGPWNNGFFGIAYDDECGIGNSAHWVEYGARVPQISVNMHRIKKIDPIEFLPQDQADWYYSVSIETDDGESQSIIYHCPDDDDDTIVNEVHTFSINVINATIKIKLMERDGWPGADDLADISGYIGGGVDDSTPNNRGAIYYGHYDLKNGYLSGDITYPDGYYLKTSGDYSPDNSTTTDQNDAKIWFNITDNYEVPIADIGPNKTVTAGEMVFFDASDSTASLGSILILYEWDWDNDGIFEESHTSPIANHSWTESEDHTVSLRVTDNFNETSTDFCQITVDPSRPIASFSYLPSNPFVNEMIIFNASSSYDLDGTIDLYMWDWDNDGIFDQFYLTPIASHSFSTVGYKYVTLKVVDNDGDNDTFTDLIQVFQARFTDYFDDYGLDTDNDGLYNYLVVEAEVEVMEAGEYELFGSLCYYNESSGWWNSIDYDYNYTYLDIGVHTVVLEFEGYKVYNVGYSGLFKVDLGLFDTINWNWIDDEDYITQSYSYIEFDGPPIEFTGVFDDYGLDTDNDGLYNYLVVEAEVEVMEAGEYELFGSLCYYNESSGWWNSIDYDYSYTYLDIGVHTVVLEFEGYKVYNVGYNGSFKVCFDLYDASNWNWIDGKEFMTQHYDYTEFQRPISDVYEPDNDFSNASWIAADGTQQYHDFHFAGDQDWLKFIANEDVSYIIETSELGIESDTYMYLYDTDGFTAITYDDDGGEGLASKIIWDCNLSGSYYIKIRHYSSTACGPDTHYNISALEWIPPAEFTDNFNDYGLDTDGNGLFDYLVIEAEINVSQAEEFYLNGELNYYNEIDGTWDWFGCYAWNHSSLDIGIHTVLLEFNGHTINNLGYNGTYKADISLANNLDQLDYAEHYTSFYNYTDFQELDKTPPNITDVHIPVYVGINHPGDISTNISDSNLNQVQIYLTDYYNITFNESLIIWYYLDYTGVNGIYSVRDCNGTYANLEQQGKTNTTSVIMLPNWTQTDKLYTLANFKKNQSTSWMQIFLEFNLSNGLLDNIAAFSTSQDGALEIEYISNMIESGVSVVQPIALILYGAWIVHDCNYTLYSIGEPNNPYLNWYPLVSGEYTGWIFATDQVYNSNFTTFNLSVNHNLPPNNPPIADAGGPYSGYVNEPVTFDASGSTDSDGSITGYRWDFDGDGVYDTGWLTSSSTTYTYTVVGTYNVNLQISDNNGANDTDSTTAVITEEVTPPPPPPPPPPSQDPPIVPPSTPPDDNDAPTADANGPYYEIINVQITFDGSGSTDDGTIESYDWDFGDGNIGIGVSPTHTYTTPGNYTVTLTVTDDGGKTDTDTTYAVITGKPNIPPSNPLVHGYVTGNKDTDYNYTAVSTDQDNDTIKYTFDWGDGTNTTTEYVLNGTEYTGMHNWTNAGIYTIKVNATDEHNASSGTAELIVLIDGHYAGEIGYFIDDDSDGIYDSFYSNETRNNTLFELQENGEYKIDINGDNEYDYAYNPLTGAITSLVGKGTTETLEILWIMIVGIIAAIAIIAVVILIYKKK